MIGRLSIPLLCPEGHKREGYVPNVVYSCGSLIHGGNLILPFAVSDRASVIATVSLEDLLAALMGGSGDLLSANLNLADQHVVSGAGGVEEEMPAELGGEAGVGDFPGLGVPLVIAGDGPEGGGAEAVGGLVGED